MISKNELTLSSNNRYFLHTPVQCTDENGKRQTQSVLIDNITDNSLWNMNTEKLKCSLLSSSSQQYTKISQINSDKKDDSSLPSANIEKCRNVSVYADANKKNVISGYIGLNDYKNINPLAFLNSPGAAPSATESIPTVSPSSTSPASTSPGATPAPTQNLGQALNDYLNPKPSPAGSPGGSPSTTQKEGFSDLLETNAFHKIKNNSILRFYFVSLLVIFIYILHRMSKKLIR